MKIEIILLFLFCIILVFKIVSIEVNNKLLKIKIKKLDNILLKIVNDINYLIKDIQNAYIIKTDKPVGLKDIAEIVEHINNLHNISSHKVLLQCDVCNHKWKDKQPKTEKVNCPNCKLNVRYEIIKDVN